MKSWVSNKFSGYPVTLVAVSHRLPMPQPRKLAIQLALIARTFLASLDAPLDIGHRAILHLSAINERTVRERNTREDAHIQAYDSTRPRQSFCFHFVAKASIYARGLACYGQSLQVG